ncbi:MAG: hypothetical protein CSB33_02690 [Desulfobacterales bacterium]|nr:MAG: hypothetical protein CSB33_02690 [Desulfobacterales bacterium]
MIQINLLPFRAARKKEDVQQQAVIFLGTILVVGVILAGITWYLNSGITKKQEEIAYLQKEVSHYNKIARQAEKLRQELVLLRKKLAVITSLDKSRRNAFSLFRIMVDMLIEKRMWLTEVKTRDQRPERGDVEKGKKDKADAPEKSDIPDMSQLKVEMEIQGIALDNKTVADFMTRLETQGMFSDVRLVTLKQEILKQKDREDISLKQFLVTCMARPIPEDLTAESLVGRKYEKPFSALVIQQFGEPEELDGTNSKQWVAWFPDGDFTITTDKKTSEITAVTPGKTPKK